MFEDVKATASMISPAVRALFAHNGYVRFSEGPVMDTAGLCVLRVEGSSIEEVDEQLQVVAGQEAEAVEVKGVGWFCIGAGKRDADNIHDMLHGRDIRRFNTLRSGRMAGKIAVVTGGASGFGASIAAQLAADGACVALADINGTAATALAGTLNSQFGTGTARALCANVAIEAEMADLVRETVLEFGGLDLFISNAGVLKSGGLETMDLENFELVTRINYTAFFLCAKYASLPMKRQRSFDRSYTADIVQINSKSGLDGSVNNFAYAGSKFGGIGLVQSFAKELVGDGIKVNAVCPGNYYDGPMWSDPDRGLFVEYLRTGKVPGAKTPADVRRYHEERTPMRRGCTPTDVIRAVYYCVEQQYETGQALPVSGGQIMLK